MKQITLLIFTLIISSFFAQEPGANQDFGKYEKQIKYDTNFYEGGSYRLELINPIKRLPKDKNWTLFEEGTQNFKNLPNITIHKSRTFLGDTTSVSIYGEYIEHRPNPYHSEVKPISYYSDFVTNKEWNLFRAYVRDSIARILLASGMGPDAWAIAIKDETGKYKDESEWNVDWKSHKLDWEKNVNNNMYEFLASQNYAESNRFYCKPLVDERKLIYTYDWDKYKTCQLELDSLDVKTIYLKYKKWHCKHCSIRENVPLFRDSTFWIKDTSFNHFSNVEDGLCQFYNYHPYFENQPVTSLNSPQARAYLHWLEANHQRNIDKESAPFTVVYELPQTFHFSMHKTEVKVSSFTLEDWRITNSDYEAFVNYTRDSIARRTLAYDFSPLIYLHPTLDDELQGKDYSEWNLNWDSKIDWKNKTGVVNKLEKEKFRPYFGALSHLFYPSQDGDTNLIDKRKLVLEQYYYDFKTAGITIDPVPTNDDFYLEECDVCKVKQPLKNYTYNNSCWRSCDISTLIGKDLRLGGINGLNESIDIYSHEDRSKFIIQDLIHVYPGVNHKSFSRNCCNGCFDFSEQNISGIELCKYNDCNLCPQYPDWDIIPQEYDFKTNPDALIQDITYYQFLAYWRWRIEKRTLPNNNENPVISHYIPSREEFEQTQAGKEISHPAEVHELPTPAFRYVVKFYPKED